MRASTWMMEIIGWYGALAVLGAYMALGLNAIEAGTLYHFLNATGAAGIGLISWRKRAWQPVALNGVWMVIAIVALIRINT